MTPNLYMNRVTSALFKSCLFVNTQLYTENELTKGGFMQVLAESNITITGTSFIGGYAMNGGAIYFIGDSSG